MWDGENIWFCDSVEGPVIYTNRNVPSFLTSTTGLAQGLINGWMTLSRVKEGVIPTEIACKPCHGVSTGITNCCTGIWQPKVHVLKYKKVQETVRHTLIER